MKQVIYSIAALMAMTAAVALPSCSKNSATSTSEGGDTIRIEAPTREPKEVNLTTKEYCAKVATMDAPFKYLGNEPAIVDFWATWCGPCRALAPVLEQLSAETGITIYKVDVDQCGDLANMYKIEYIPQLYYCNNGKITPIENQGDNYSLQSLKKLIAK